MAQCKTDNSSALAVELIQFCSTPCLHNGLAQNSSNSSVLAMELPQFLHQPIVICSRDSLTMRL